MSPASPWPSSKARHAAHIFQCCKKFWMLLLFGKFQGRWRSGSASPSSPHTDLSGQGRSCPGLDSQEPRQRSSGTAFGNVCLCEPTGWPEGKNNILRKPAGLGGVRSGLPGEGRAGALLRMGFAPLLPAHPRPFGVTFWGQLFWITLLESPFWDHPFGVPHPTVTLRGHPFGVTHPTVTQRELPLPTPPGAVPCRPLPGKLFTRLSQPQSTARPSSARLGSQQRAAAPSSSHPAPALLRGLRAPPAPPALTGHHQQQREPQPQEEQRSPPPCWLHAPCRAVPSRAAALLLRSAAGLGAGSGSGWPRTARHGSVRPHVLRRPPPGWDRPGTARPLRALPPLPTGPASKLEVVN